jgi:hypothetical protein
MYQAPGRGKAKSGLVSSSPIRPFFDECSPAEDKDGVIQEELDNAGPPCQAIMGEAEVGTR